MYADVSKYVYCFFVMIMMHIFRLYMQYQRIYIYIYTRVNIT